MTEVALYDVDEVRLATITTILQQLAIGFSDVPTLRTHTDLESALEGADFVFAAIRVGGVEQRCCDEHVALDLNVLGQETTGPGGIAYALRTLPVMLDIVETIRRVAPKAYFLNFTNPAGIITEALQGVLGDRALGICDTPSGLGRRVAGVLGYDHTRVQMDYVGLNHLGWMRRVLVDGVDVLPALLADDERLARMEETQVFGAEWLRTLGSIPNEYLYYYYYNRDAVRRILESRRRGEISCWRPRIFLHRRCRGPRACGQAMGRGGRRAWRQLHGRGQGRRPGRARRRAGTRKRSRAPGVCRCGARGDDGDQP